MKSALFLVACIALPAVMSPAEQNANAMAEKQARVREMNVRHMPFVLRIGNKFPPADLAQLDAPISTSSKEQP